VPLVCYDKRRLTRAGRVACANDRTLVNPVTDNVLLRGRDTHLRLCRDPITRQVTSKCKDFKPSALAGRRVRRATRLATLRRRLSGLLW